MYIYSHRKPKPNSKKTEAEPKLFMASKWPDVKWHYELINNTIRARGGEAIKWSTQSRWTEIPRSLAKELFVSMFMKISEFTFCWCCSFVGSPRFV